MNTVAVRSRVSRRILMLLVAVFLAVVSYDIVAGHWVSAPPERDEETGAITSRGLSQQRTDYLWGSLLMVSAVGLGVVAISGLVRRDPVVEIAPDAIRLRVDRRSEYVTIPWDQVRWVHSGSDAEDGELVATRVLLVEVVDPERLPVRLWGAEWDGSTMKVDADTWKLPPEEVAAHAQVAMDGWRRHAESLSGAAVDSDVIDDTLFRPAATDSSDPEEPADIDQAGRDVGGGDLDGEFTSP